MTKTFVLVLLFVCLFSGIISAQVTVMDGIAYSSINSSVRLYRAFYPAATPVTSKLPIVVYVHGGGWFMGGRADATITPSVCNDDSTIACYLAHHGYIVYAIDYTLVTTVAQGMDLKVVGPNQVSAASHAFKSTDIGDNLVIAANSGFAGGGFTVTSVSAGTATLASSPGAIGLANGSYALIKAGTYWPVQWQDCNCFLRYLAENASVRVPGDPANIHIMGHSAGGHLALMMGLSGNTAFRTNCEHTSTKYTVESVIAASPPSDLATLYPVSNGQLQIRNFLGCVPGTSQCASTAAAASPVSYVAQNQPFVATFSGSLDTTIPYSNVQEIQSAYLNLRPSVTSPWTLFQGMSHALDVYYGQPCSSLNEPWPCGSAGHFFGDAFAYIQQQSTAK